MYKPVSDNDRSDYINLLASHGEYFHVDVLLHSRTSLLARYYARDLLSSRRTPCGLEFQVRKSVNVNNVSHTSFR